MTTKQAECFYPVCGCHSECQSKSGTTTADKSQIDRAHGISALRDALTDAELALVAWGITAALADIVAIDRTETPPHAR